MSAATFYIALVHKDADSDFGVSFPDFPGCITAGATLAEAAAMATEALEGHVGLMIDEGEVIPAPSTMDAILADPDNRDGTPVMVPIGNDILRKAKAVRVNVTIPEDALRAIDRYAEDHGLTRSGMLTQAARRMMAEA